MADYDVAIIGGGLNGTAIARDAAGRGLRVILFEQDDLGSAASSSSSRLIQGDLARLERGALLSVRTALAERSTLLRTAPHLTRPIRVVIPAHADERRPWQLRGLLLIHDALASGSGLPSATTLDVTHHPVGVALQRPFGTAFAYSGCAIDDSRLVVLNAVDAAERGAAIRTGARCVRADRGDSWRLAVIDRGQRRVITARALVNATGAWTGSVFDTVLRLPAPPLRLLKATRIVVGRLFETDHVYLLQNHDGRLIYAAPYGPDFTLVGSVERGFEGDPAIVAATASEIAYLCDAANRYFRARIEPADVVRGVAGANAVVDRRARRPVRDGFLQLEHRTNEAPLLTISAGDITTSRKRAEQAVSLLTPFYPMSRRWTATAPLPGGDFAWARFDDQVEKVRESWGFLGEAEARRLVAAYGTRVERVLGTAQSRDELGPTFGPDLTGAEVRYLMRDEWARFPEDVLWRRSKLGLTMPVQDRERLAAFMAEAG
ncbi:MAG: glycerol-3-phosphate dehydrogenase [Rhodopseudomonas sp.]|uniref:glycerol-3-phosphate dehydrogenase n=1 Tax=Rhodopseudomonas sp. TaxID=1078 RepID=UPI00185D1AD6|nr:glycerol-3-phosphate dehydrogenase [Rhodopseudomonas sp.]NVN88094.1 glycerol-3-phosphate dehydrogenase [Rhodopseudomonas sp.]